MDLVATLWGWLEKFWPYLAGYVLAVVVGHFPVSYVVDRMWKARQGWERNQINLWEICFYEAGHTGDNTGHTGDVVGFAERSLYFWSVILGKPEVIGFWLVLKVAGQWQRQAYNQGRRDQHNKYNIFLVGTALSVFYAVGGALFSLWWVADGTSNADKELYAWTYAMAVVFGAGLAPLLILIRFSPRIRRSLQMHLSDLAKGSKESAGKESNESISKKVSS